MENCQVAVFAAYASTAGHALIHRELYLRNEWAGDRERLRRAGVPEQVGFATKPVLAMLMIERALAAGTPCAWPAGDCVYGQDPALRAFWIIVLSIVPVVEAKPSVS